MRTRKARKSRQTRGAARAIAGVVALAAWLTGSDARADDRLRISIDWARLAGVMHDFSAFLPRESWQPGVEHGSRINQEQPRSFGLSPHLSLFARDWGSTQLLLGHLAPTDQVRLSRSSRMVVSRVRIVGERFAPFVQAGLGQWRVDTDLMPVLPRDVSLAAQVGGGFEFAVWSRAAFHAVIALEADYTVLYREQREPQMVSGPHLWGTFFAARARF
jgi:hypothetical protein